MAEARAFQQSGLQSSRPVMLAQEIHESLVGQRLKRDPAVSRQEIERLPGLLVDLNAFPGH
jgi:hypothetical protein